MEIKLFKTSKGILKNQCYLVHNNEECILIDPAWDFNVFNNFITEERLTLKAVLLTHSHTDHTDLAATFTEKYNVPVFMSEVEIENYGYHCPNLKGTTHLEEIKINDWQITSLLTPGHTSGGACYLINHHLFTGDTVFIEGVGTCMAKGGNAEELYHSVQFLKSYLPNTTLIWPGHSFGEPPGKTLQSLCEQNIYFCIEKKEQFITFRMRKKQPGLFDFK